MRNHLSWLTAMLVCVTLTPLSAQTRVVTGKVTDSLTSDPVTSGQVSVGGTTISTTIRDDGTFTLAAPTRDFTLTVRSIGFKRKDVAVPASQSAAAVALARDYFQLEAIVVTGQATGVEKRNLANAVSTVGQNQLARVPVSSVSQDLMGKVAGAEISDNSGAPGGGQVVRLRGVTSIIGTFTPLYVVDGLIVSDATIQGGSNIVTQAFRSSGIAGNQDNGVDRIADLNPGDIENVEILKGAAASAIYGSKASNGVILITTKHGRVGVPQFTLSERVGVSHERHLFGSRTFTSAAEAQSVFGPQGAADFTAAGGQVFNNEQGLIGNTPFSHETDASVSGGTETTRYFASGLVKHEGGIVNSTFADKQSLRLNLDQTVGRRLTLSAASEVIHTSNDRGLTNNENNGTSWYAALSNTPSFFDLRGTCGGTRTAGTQCPDGSVPVFPVNPYQSSNPFQSAALFQNRENVWRSIFNGRVQYDAVSSAQHTLRFTAVGGGDVFTQKNDVFAPAELQFEGLTGLPGLNALSLGVNQTFNANGNLVYTYKTSSGTSATTQVGVQFETRNQNISRTAGQNLVGGVHNVQTATSILVENAKQLTKDLGYFAQEEFLTLNEKLLLTVGARADQSSNNADPAKLSWYPKAAASYRFVLHNGLLSELKLRSAIGFSGNEPQYGQKFTELATGNIVGIATSIININGTTGAADLRPEREREIEAGFDGTLFSGRGSIEASIYEKHINDLLLTRTLAPTTGFTSLFFNGGTMRTRGLEVALSLAPVQKSSVQWNVRGNFALNRCTILDLPVPAFRPTSFLNSVLFGSTFIEPGQSCTQLQGLDTLGSQPGDAALGAVGSIVTRRFGDANPNYHFSVGNDLTYKHARLSFLVDRQAGGLLANYTELVYCLNQNCRDFLTPNGPGGLTGQQRANAFGRATSSWFESTSYLKLREVSLSVDLPESFVRRFMSGSRYVRVGVSGRNLLTFTSYRGADPEMSEIARSAAEGIPWELWSYPPSRSVYFNVDLGF